MRREQLVKDIAEMIMLDLIVSGIVSQTPSDHERETVMFAADAALRVVEAPASRSEDYSRICTCGQNGYPENHWHSNHPHEKGCPQYSGLS